MIPEKDCDSPSTPATSRSVFMRQRKRYTPHCISLLRQPGIAKELWELHYDQEEYEKSSSSKETNTSQTISNDSGIDVSQASGESKEKHCYFLRNKDPFK
ncbi:hypothetical protein KR032_007755 [Drosophila birchii]|nr:hypothetical protein KR032_007755 [Drosophila birchii]